MLALGINREFKTGQRWSYNDWLKLLTICKQLDLKGPAWDLTQIIRPLHADNTPRTNLLPSFNYQWQHCNKNANTGINWLESPYTPSERSYMRKLTSYEHVMNARYGRQDDQYTNNVITQGRIDHLNQLTTTIPQEEWDMLQQIENQHHHN